MKLTAKRDGAGSVAFVNGEFDWTQLGADQPLKREPTVSAGYADISGPRAWVKFGQLLGITEVDIREEVLAFVGQWATLSTDDRQAMVEVFAYPPSATTAELDFLYPTADRESFRQSMASAIATHKHRQTVIDALGSDAPSAAVNMAPPPAGTEAELGRVVLATAGDVLTVSGFSAKRFLRVLAYLIPSGGDIDTALRFNGDAAGNYSDRMNENAGEIQASFANGIRLQPGSYNERFFVNVEIVNVSNRAKLVTGTVVREGGTGAGVIPTRALISARWENTSAAIIRVDIVQRSGARDFAAGSELIVRGLE